MLSLWLVVTFGLIPSGVCIVAPFTTSTSTISHFLRFLFRMLALNCDYYSQFNNPTSAAPAPPSPTGYTSSAPPASQ